MKRGRVILAGAVMVGVAIAVLVWVLEGRKGGDTAGPPPGPEPAKDPEPKAPHKDAAPTYRPAPVLLATASAFLYTGDNPRQVGVKAGTIEARRAAVLRGVVRDRDGAALGGVTVSVLRHPEFGSTLTRADGEFDLVVNGGGPVCVQYQKKGFFPAKRQAAASWQDYTWLPDVVLVPADGAVTDINLKADNPVQVARGSPVRDQDGERRPTLLLAQGTQAVMTLPDGTEKPLTRLSVRATEYTVGGKGPAAMPAPLPPASAYTYAVELSADEVIAEGVKIGGKDLELSKPAVFYVENFLKFPTGIPVPTGYYDNDKAAWIASDSGRVVQILSVANDLAEIDVEGGGKPANAASLAKLGFTDAERRQVAQLYKPGQSLWRVTVPHFSTWDCNWGFSPPGDAVPPGQDDPEEEGTNNPCYQGGSVIDVHNQVLGESVGLTGTPFRLHYQSDRVFGRKAARTLHIPLSGGTIPKSLKRIELEILVAGRRFTETALPAKPNQRHTFTWDGLDAYGRPLTGPQSVTVRIGYVYDGVYEQTPRFGYTGNGQVITGSRTRQEVALWEEHRALIGGWDARAHGLGGWTVDVHHAYDPVGRNLYLGDGRRVDTGGATGGRAMNLAVSTVAGGGTQADLGDGGPAVQARIDNADAQQGAGFARDRFMYSPRGVAVAPDGSLYIADANNRVRRVNPDGTITTIAGGGKGLGDGGPATQAQLVDPVGLALGQDGSLYIAEGWQGNRVRRVGPDGTITTVAGQTQKGKVEGEPGFSGDGGPAKDAMLDHPTSIAVTPDGTLYVADSHNHRVRRVGPDGAITTVAGAPEKAGRSWKAGYSGDGGPAARAKLYWPNALALGPDGSLYVSDSGNYVVRRISPTGMIITVAGMPLANYKGGYGGDGGPATRAKLNDPTGLAIGPDGSLYVGDTHNHRVRRVALDGTITTFAGSEVQNPDSGDFAGDGGPAAQAKLSFPAGLAFGPDGSLYVYDGSLHRWQNNMRHPRINHRVRRISPPLPGFTAAEVAVTSADGGELYKFSATGRHLETRDALTQAVRYRFDHDAAGRLTKITDAYGNATTVERDAEGRPAAVLAPFGQRTTLGLDANGYLADISNPAKEAALFAYSADGLMATFTDLRGGVHRFTFDALGRLIKDEDPAGGFTELGREVKDRGFTVRLTTALKPPATYLLERLPTGEENRLNQCCCGAETKVGVGRDGTRTAAHPDGTIAVVGRQPHPQWGMQSPLLKGSTLTTPGGIKATISVERTADLADPGNPLSLRGLTETFIVNGRKYTTTFDAANKSITGSSPAGRRTTATLDDHGRVGKAEIPGLPPVNFGYDGRGRLTTVTQGTGGEPRVTGFSYDDQGRISAVTDPLKRTVRLEYDGAGRLVKQSMPDNRAIAFEFDPSGNLKSITPPGKSAHGFERTPVNLTSGYSPPEAGTGPRETGYEFDKDRKLTKVSRPDGKTVALAYSKVGLLESLTVPGRELRFTFDPKTEQLRGIAGADGSLSFGYDGLLPTETKWDGPVKGSVTRLFDSDFRVTSIRVNGGPAAEFKYDADGLLTEAGALKLERDPKTGFLKRTQLGNVGTAQEYTGFGECGKFVARFGGKDIMAVDYEHDLLGRIRKKTETIEGRTDVYAYEYDLAGRLGNVSRNGKLVGQYEYDANGNRIKYDGQRGTFAGSFDAQDRIRSHGPIVFEHNANGDLVSKTEAGKTTAYEYDALGNLRSVALPDGVKIEYLLDALGTRIGKKINGKLVQGFLWQDRVKPIAELDVGGHVVSRFIYTGQVNVPEYMEKGGRTYRIIKDHLGSPRLVVDVESGAVAQQMDYDEFGVVLADSNPGFQPFGFAGGIYDPQTKLTRFGARDYDGFSGRWTGKDPIGFAGGDTNLYGYVRNDPINRADPRGMDHPGRPLWYSYTRRDPYGPVFWCEGWPPYFPFIVEWEYPRTDRFPITPPSRSPWDFLGGTTPTPGLHWTPGWGLNSYSGYTSDFYYKGSIGGANRADPGPPFTGANSNWTDYGTNEPGPASTPPVMVNMDILFF